jgi:hypothetical protein
MNIVLFLSTNRCFRSDEKLIVSGTLMSQDLPRMTNSWSKTPTIYVRGTGSAPYVNKQQQQQTSYGSIPIKLLSRSTFRN